MATWFAQNSSVNIDSVNQWNSAANGSGSWLTWASLGATDVLVANGKTAITINVPVVCGELTTIANGGTAGGGFIWPGGVAITANLKPGTSTLLTPSGSGSRIITGHCYASPGTGGAYACSASADTITVTGSIFPGTVDSARTFNNCSSMIVVGDIAGSNSHANASPINLDTGGTVVVTGNLTAGAAGNAIYGNAGTTTITVTGNITASNSVAAIKQNTGTLNFRLNGQFVSSSTGTVPICGPILNVLIDATAIQTHTYRVNNSGSAGVARSLYTGGVNLGQPTQANVREGIVFGASSEYTGTLAVPSPTLVAIGVDTDDTIGSYAPTGGLDAAGVRSAIGLAAANLDTQLSGLQSDTNDIQTRLPSALESGRIAAVLDSADKAALVDLIWDEPLTGATHNVATSSGKRLRQTTAFQQIDSTVIDAAATTTTFVTGLTSSVDDFYNDSMLVFTDGALAGQVRAIYDYIGATKTIILEEALTSAPVNGVAFAIVSLHIHPVSQIQSGLATSAALATESTKITNIENASGYLLAIQAGACADPQTASETYTITIFGSTFTVDMAGQTSTGTRTAPTLTKV
jgi:hypothetical protein